MKAHMSSGLGQAGSKTLRYLTAAALMAGMLVASTGTAQAFTQPLNDLIEEYVRCKILLLTDLDQHDQECAGVVTGPFESIASPGGAAGTPPAVITPITCDEGSVLEGNVCVPVEEEEKEEECYSPVAAIERIYCDT